MEIKTDTKKIIIGALIAVVVLNVLGKELQKSFEKSVLEVVKKNPEGFKTALGNLPTEVTPPSPAQPSEEELFKQQLEDKTSVDIGNTPILGRRDAKIQLIVFSDFQCPFSKRGADTTHALIQKYGNKIMYVYKNLPLPFHPEAMPAAKAALAAGRQGKYYEYHDKLFENQDKLGEPLYLQLAKDLGLNIDKFNTDRKSKEIEDQINADTTQASAIGFNGTPGFTLNGVKILGAYPIEHFEKVISALGVS
ncbi:MAG: thioredoxin domain-containing protein [Candidatus Melainabacteria bacterium]|nr:thioredoxin domain-containing protein [Candidatus Melainabacteria bacterium]